MEIELTCQVCLGQYDSKGHRPLLLPACGHTFCAFCMELLRQQGKRFCPKCRKDEAVQPISSLPVNYSLLEITQSRASGVACVAAAAATAHESEAYPSSPTEERSIGKSADTSSLPASHAESSSPHKTRPDSSGLPAVRPKSHRIMQRQSSYLHQKRLLSAHRPTQARPDIYSSMFPGLFHQSVPEVTTWSNTTRDITLSTQATGSMDVCNSSFADKEFNRELQDELDFQLAVHLTFCKDTSHDQDLHTRCPSWRQQSSDSDDLGAILSRIQQI